MEDYQKRRKLLDQIFKICLKMAGFLSATMIIFIFFFVMTKGISPFLSQYGTQKLNLGAFLTGRVWRADQGIYGIYFVVVNTLVSAFFAVCLAFPIATLTALYIVKVASERVSLFLTMVVEMLAAVPSIVYGVFAAGVFVRWVDQIASVFGQDTFGGRSLLAVILLLATMILPTMTSLSIVAIKAVPKKLEEGSLALGATPMQTNFKVVLLSAKSGIVAGLILGLARAFGEATAVSLVAGNKLSGPTLNPFDITRTLTSTMLLGLNETTGVDYDVRFSVGIVLMMTIVFSNLLIAYFKKKVGKSS